MKTWLIIEGRYHAKIIKEFFFAWGLYEKQILKKPLLYYSYKCANKLVCFTLTLIKTENLSWVHIGMCFMFMWEAVINDSWWKQTSDGFMRCRFTLRAAALSLAAVEWKKPNNKTLELKVEREHECRPSFPLPPLHSSTPSGPLSSLPSFWSDISVMILSELHGALPLFHPELTVHHRLRGCLTCHTSISDH